MKKLVKAVSAVLLVIVLSQSAAAAENTTEIDPSMNFMPGSRIAVVSKTTKGEFWEQVRSGMENAVKEINETFSLTGDDKIYMTFEGPGDEKQVENQINTLDAVIAENPDVLCLCAGDMNSCQAQIEAAKENGIPIVVFDSYVTDMSLVSAYRSTDNRKVGTIAAEKMAEALKEEGKLIVFSAQAKTSTVKDRVEGFESMMKEFPDIEVIEVIYDDQVEDMAAAMKEAFEKNPDIDGVYCTNDEISNIFLDLPESEDRQSVFIGTDASKKQQEAIRSGKELGCVSQNPREMGFQTILAAIQLTGVDGVETVEEESLIEPMWIDSTSIASPEAADYLY